MPEREPAPAVERPRLAEEVLTGLGAGLAAGVLLGAAEAAAIVTRASPPRDGFVLGWAAVASGLVFALVGAALGALLWAGARLLRHPRADRSRRHASIVAGLVSGYSLVVAWTHVSRALLPEHDRATTPTGVALLGLFAAASAGLFLSLRWALRRLTAARAGRFLVRTWGAPAIALAAALGLIGAAIALDGDAARPRGRSSRAGVISGDRPNVVLVMVDTLRADHLSLYGDGRETAPALAAFAREATVFRSAFAQASWTRPSVATLLSGRYPSSHRTTSEGDALPDEVETLAEVLRSSGYSTNAVVSNYNLAPYFNFQQGFDFYEYLAPDSLLWADDNVAKLTLHGLLRRLAALLPLPARPGPFYQDAQVVTDRVLARLAATPSEEAPFFLFVSYMDPHDPYFRHPYDGHAVGHAFTPDPAASMAGEMVELYDGEIRYWDHHFGRLLDALRRRPDWHRTVVILCADHGEEFFEHGGWWHGSTLFDEQLRVPLLVRLPGGELGGSVETRWVGLIDVAPTAARLAGAVTPAAMALGVDLFATGGAARAMFAEEAYEGNVLRSVRYRHDGEEWKLIEADAGNPRGLPPQALFELGSDPGERRDRADRDGRELDRAEAALDQAAAAAAAGAASSRSADGLDDVGVEQLRRLGYLDGGPPGPR
jgi:arylsulfatase A-like enzyme